MEGISLDIIPIQPLQVTYAYMEVSGDEIAEAVQSQFDGLPQKRKPQARGDGLQEWVPLSGVVAQGANP